MGSYHLRRSGSNQFYFHLRGNNQEVILQSEMYTSKQAARNGIQACRVNSPFDPRYQRLVAQNSLPYFVLRGGNNEVIGVSETYSSNAARETGIQSCKSNGPGSPEYDETGT